MKFALPQFQVGDRVSADVVEILRDGSMIVRFRGDLIRVQNQSGKQLHVGEAIALVVTAIRPYAFRLAEPGKGHFDVSI
ncbi:MAG: hypothetical protein IT288_08115 [Bdellovibrionales bacterium]|nr:hypothetical protein [Bdellovibrionales bacterium]